MATKKVHIDILAKDKTRAALRGAQKGINNLKNSVFSLKSALIGIGVGATVKSFITVGSEIEKLQVSLKGPGDFVTFSDKKVEKILDIPEQSMYNI